MQCKDIPVRPIMEMLDRLGEYKWASMFSIEIAGDRSVFSAMPPNTPPAVARAKMAKLIRKGWIDGCTCGCRGDFVITSQGQYRTRNGHLPGDEGYA